MFEFLKKLWKKEPVITDYKEEKLFADSDSDPKELQVKTWEIINEKKICPNCGAKSPFYEGPCGGLSMNIICGNCHVRFWLTPMKDFGAYMI